MDGTGFAYMTQPPVEQPKLASQITWVVASAPAGAAGAGGAGGAGGAAACDGIKKCVDETCDHEADEDLNKGCSAGYRCAINVKRTGTSDDPKVQAMLTAMVEGRGSGSACVAEALCDVATEIVAGVTMTLECSASYMVATVFSTLALSYAI